MRQVLWCALFLAASAASPAMAHDPISWTGPRWYVIECGDKGGSFYDGTCEHPYLIAGPFPNLTECSDKNEAIDSASGLEGEDHETMCQKFTSDPKFTSNPG